MDSLFFLKVGKMEPTVCSSMHCYEPVKQTNDPAKPPFCDKCKKKVKSI